MAHKVFICHSSKDKIVADAACAALEAHRIPCWIAPRDILAGEEYGAAIIDALEECQVVLLIFSLNANNSPQVRREIERAVSKEKILVPFRIENVLPSHAMEFALMNTHWLDALTPPMEGRLTELCNTISRLIQKHTPAEPLWTAPIDETEVHQRVVGDSAQEQAKQPAERDKLTAEPERIRHAEESRTKAETRPVDQSEPQSDIQVQGRSIRWKGWAISVGGAAMACLVALLIYSMYQRRFLLKTVKADNTVTQMAFSPDGHILASGELTSIKLRDSTTGQLLTAPAGESALVHAGSLPSPSGVSSVVFIPNGHTLASGSPDKTINLWDTSSQSLLRTLLGHSESVVSLAVSPDGHTLASSSDDLTIKLWDPDTGKLLRTMQGHTDKIWALTFSPDGRTLASSSLDKTIKLWNPATGQLLHSTQGHYSPFNSLAFSPDGRILASSTTDDGDPIEFWNPVTGDQTASLHGNGDGVWSIAFSPDGRTIAAANTHATITLWDVAARQPLRILKGHTGIVEAVAFSPDGRTLASGGDDKTVRLWDIAAALK